MLNFSSDFAFNKVTRRMDTELKVWKSIWQYVIVFLSSKLCLFIDVCFNLLIFYYLHCFLIDYLPMFIDVCFKQNLFIIMVYFCCMKHIWRWQIICSSMYATLFQYGSPGIIMSTSWWDFQLHTSILFIFVFLALSSVLVDWIFICRIKLVVWTLTIRFPC